MENPLPEKEKIKKRWFNRLDSAATEVNPVLLVLAIGLAVLDFTCLFAIEMRAALPLVRRVGAEPSPAAKPSIPADQSVIAWVPAKPAPPAAGP
jgi:hypothetical protein